MYSFQLFFCRNRIRIIGGPDFWHPDYRRSTVVNKQYTLTILFFFLVFWVWKCSIFDLLFSTDLMKWWNLVSLQWIHWVEIDVPALTNSSWWFIPVGIRSDMGHLSIECEMGLPAVAQSIKTYQVAPSSRSYRCPCKWLIGLQGQKLSTEKVKIKQPASRRRV